MLVTTAESLAGQTVISGTCQNCGHEYQYGGTNRQALVAVLGEEVYNQLYKKSGGSLRNRLLHGSAIDENAAAALCNQVYENILAHLSRVLHLLTIEHINGAPRRFDSLEWFGAFLKANSDNVPPLRDLERNWHSFEEWIDQLQGY